MTKNKNKPSAAQKLFSEYTQEITRMFLEEFGPSYATQNEVRNTWRHNVAYSEAAQKFLIMQTLVFLRLLNTTNENGHNLQFLEKLTKLMADYLSAYTMRDPDISTRKQAQKKLQKQLFEESSHVRYLANSQAERAQRHQKNKENAEKFADANQRVMNKSERPPRRRIKHLNGTMVYFIGEQTTKKK